MYKNYLNPWLQDLFYSDVDTDSLTDDYDDSLTEESSDESSVNDHKNFIISIYKNKDLNSTNIITNATEIINYREKYSQLTQKNTKNINNIWGEVKVDIPSLGGSVPLKAYDDNLKEPFKCKKKCLKKPKFAIPKKVVTISDTCSVISTPKKNEETQSEVYADSKNSNVVESQNTPQSKSKKINDSQSTNLKKTDEVVSQKAALSGSNKVVKTNFINIIEKSIIQEEIKFKSTNTSEASTVIDNKNSQININNKNMGKDTEFKKPYNKDINPNLCSKMDETKKDNAQLNSNEKLSKKKLKKQNQKEKRLENNKGDSSNSSSRDASESNKKTLTPNKNSKNNNKSNNNTPNKKSESNKSNNVTPNKKSENNKNNSKKKTTEKNDKKQTNKSIKEKIGKGMDVNEENTKHSIEIDGVEDMIDDSDDDMDLLTDSNNMPSFIAELIKRKQKNHKQISTKPVEPVVKRIPKTVESKNVNEQPFIIHTRKHEKPTVISDKQYILYSEQFGEEAINMILKNNFMAGLEYIVEAINYNPADHRHILNRCYCYLRMNKNALALTDAQYVLKTSTNIGYIFMANLRAGQASFALQKYQEAETYLKEATRINPENHHVQRQLMRVKITIIVTMGFKEKDALMALEMYSSTLEAVNYLISKNKNNSHSSSFENDCELPDDSSDDLIYSSDEDENPNNVEILNRILHYKPGKEKLFHMVAKPLNAGLLLSHLHDRNGKNNSEIKKKVAVNGQEKAIWVGNLTNAITDAMLKKKFKQFGNVISIYRPLNEAYGFINFEKSEHVTNVLINNSCHEIAGVKLAVRSAVRQK